MDHLKRWVLLRHTVPLDDFSGNHFDLLLEDQDACRTWRLEQIPILDAPQQKVIALSLHSKRWLETDYAEVSGGRGWARRVSSGLFKGLLPISEETPVRVELQGNHLEGILEIDQNLCQLVSFRKLGARM